MHRVVGSEGALRRFAGQGKASHPPHAARWAVKHPFSLALLALLLFIDPGDAFAGPIRWRNAVLEPGEPAPNEAAEATSHLVVGFSAPLTPQQRANLELTGIRLLAYLGDNAFFAVRARNKDLAPAPSAITPVADFQTIRREWKLHPRLVGGAPPDWAMVPMAADHANRAQVSEKNNVRTVLALAAYVLFHGDVALSPDGLNACTRHGAVVRDQLPSVNGLVIELPFAAVPNLAGEDVVQWIEPALPRMDVVNDNCRILTQADLVQAAPYGLDGTGVNVLLYDGGTAWPDHPDFGGRVVVRDASGLSSHATHVAGTVGGNGKASDGQYRGVAPGVAIQSYGFEYDGAGVFLYSNPGDIEADYREAVQAYGAEIANNSIGANVARNGFPCELEGSYGVTSAVIDAIVAGSLGSPMRIVWAAGNERSSGRCGNAYATISPPAPAKNHIAVGAVNSNDDSMSWFSSWGPTDDGRLRPDVVAPGCQANGDLGVRSTGTDGGYAVLCGTSMAAPAVTGVCALLLQDHKRLYPGTPLPTNAMLKAILVHTAADLGAVGPDYQTGYGSVRAREAIDLLRSGSFRQGILSQGESKAFLVQVEPGTTSLKATIAWDDPAAAVNTIPALVNDLDLVAISPSGAQVHYPWTLDPANPGLEASRIQPDRLNNLEQVRVDGPEPGLWMIRVRGYAVPMGPQAFSLVATPDLVGCSSTGTVSLSAQEYRCDAGVVVTVHDCDLNADPAVAEPAAVHIASTSDPVGRALVLTEVGTDTGAFIGYVALSDASSPDGLLVAHGDALTVAYRDADAGSGAPGEAMASAAVDCVAPTISAVRIEELAALSAAVSFTTDEPSFARVRFGASCDALDRTAIDAATSQTHRLALTGLRPATRYEYFVEAVDASGNLAREDAGGTCMAFTTPDAPDYYTQHFLLEPKTLDHKSLLFTPDGSIDYYAVCIESIAELPVDPSGGEWLRNTSQIILRDGKQILLYGMPRSSFWVNSEGTITLDQWDNTTGGTLARHFAVPRISALFEWFTPAEAGHVSWKQLADRAVVTWEHVRDAATGGSSTFQAELFFDGQIRLSWLDINANDPLVGLSKGGGVPVDFLESRLNDAVPCVVDSLRLGPGGPLAVRGLVGGPFVPLCRSFTLTNASDPPDTLPWSAETGVAWASVMPGSGELPPGGSQEVKICITAQAGDLPANVNEYVAEARFVNATTGVGQVREVQLAVQAASPPTAHDVLATTTLNAPAEIRLAVDDDGRPVSPGRLTYRVVSGPGHGQLSMPDGTGLVTYTPPLAFEGIDQFTYQASDGGVAPDGGESRVATVTIRVLGPPRPAVNPAPADGAAGVPIDEPFLAAQAVDVSRLRAGIVAAAYPADVSDPHFTDVRDKIMATGRFSEIGVINAGRVTPAPADLEAFDAVIVWSNDQFADPFTLGDRLADYVDRGGGVVVAVFANVAVRSFSTLAGRFLQDDYLCIAYPGDSLFPPLLDRPRNTLDRVFLPDHPTMSGVTCFDGGDRSFRIWSSYLAPGASFVANWSDGAPLIAVREVNGTPRVDLGLHPPSDTVEQGFWQATTDGGLILANALAFTAGRSGCATTYDVYFGVNNPPTDLLCRNLLDPRCPMPPTLAYGVQYYWQVVAHHVAGNTPGPVWSFRTPEPGSMTVSDSVSPPDDREVAFGNVAIGASRLERITLRNDHASEALRLAGLSLVPAADVAADFEDGLADGWRPASAGEWTVQNGEFRASSSVPDSRMQATYTKRTWADASIRLSLRRTGSPFIAAGVAFRASEDFDWAAGTGSACLAALSGSGSFYLARVDGDQFTFIQPWSTSKSLKVLTGTNDIVVNVAGPDIGLYLNGQLAWAGRDTTISGTGRVALLAYSNPPGTQDATHYFDNIQIGLPLPFSTGIRNMLTTLQVPPDGETGTATVVPHPELPEAPDASAAAILSTADGFVVPDPCAGFALPSLPSTPVQLEPGETVDLDVVFKPAWQGSQVCDVLIATNDADHPRQRVHLTGNAGPACLQIAPADGLSVYGPEGGPFTPSCGQYMLSNTGPNLVRWSIATSAGWVTVSPAVGSLEPGQSTSVDLCVAGEANALTPGDYRVVITITDTTTGLSENRMVRISVCRLPQAPVQPVPADQETGVSVIPSLAWNVGVSPLQTCSSIGTAKISYQDREVALASVVAVSGDQLLREITARLSFAGTADLYYLIGESSTRQGPFDLVWQRRVPTAGQGETDYSSGSLDYQLVAGRFYAVGVAWGDTLIGYGLDYRAYPAPWTAGTIEGVVSGRRVPPVAEMPTDFFSGAATPIRLCLDDAGAVTHHVFLWQDGHDPALACSGAVGSTCAVPGLLAQGVLYHWKVVAVSACGTREGPTWSFTTAVCAEGLPEVDRSPGRRPVSRKNHGSAGDVDVDLLTPAFGQVLAIEPRNDGPTSLIVHFTRPIRVTDTRVDSSVVVTGPGAARARITDVSAQGDRLSIACEGLAAGEVRLSFPGIADADNPGCGVQDSISFGVLAGDVNGDGVVNLSDMLAVRSHLATPVDAERYRSDLVCDGVVDLKDLLDVRDHLNNRLQIVVRP